MTSSVRGRNDRSGALVTEGWKAQLIISCEGRESTEPEFEGRPVTLEVGVPKGRLRATGPAGRQLFLRLHVDDAFMPDVVAPTDKGVEDGLRLVQIPGLGPANQNQEWHLNLIETSVEEYEAFLGRLQIEGCTIVRSPCE